VRLGCEQWAELSPEDVAWVVEWQLASAFPWLPVQAESRVNASPRPEPDRRWLVHIRTGGRTVAATLPLRDLARLVHWGHVVRGWPELVRVPATVRASALVVRAVLRKALESADPLIDMGYPSTGAKPTGEP
jgi:hypothetical protein